MQSATALLDGLTYFQIIPYDKFSHSTHTLCAHHLADCAFSLASMSSTGSVAASRWMSVSEPESSRIGDCLLLRARRTCKPTTWSRTLSRLRWLAGDLILWLAAANTRAHGARRSVFAQKYTRANPTHMHKRTYKHSHVNTQSNEWM